MSSSTQHITKVTNDTTKRRRFQPPITTFFSAATPESNDNDYNDCTTPRLSHYHYSAATFSPVPAVPAKVQSSLLNVGMRVRKSVADGYKTLAVKPDEKPTYRLEQKQQQQQPIRQYPDTSNSELAPFCGSSKTGYVGVQPFAHPSSAMDYHHNELVTDEGDAFSLPSSSQESTESSEIPLNGQKRSYDSDDEMDDFADENDQPSGFLKGTSLPASSPHGRTILAPTLGQQRRRFISIKNQKAAGHMDVDDFGEASFLRRREDVDADYSGRGHEVEMNGI